eukprot:2518632-Alexandrium_andersonii.AAC.1
METWVYVGHGKRGWRGEGGPRPRVPLFEYYRDDMRRSGVGGGAPPWRPTRREERGTQRQQTKQPAWFCHACGADHANAKLGKRRRCG